MKLAAKFARQETEAARLARIARRRIPEDRADAVRRMLGGIAAGARGAFRCPECDRAFALPMHRGRHVKSRHATPSVA
jgi:hypothetical protein